MATSTPLNGGAFYLNDSVNSGTGNYDSFLRIENSPSESGYNLDGATPLNDKGGIWTHSIQLSGLQVVTVGGIDYYLIRLDLNESNASGGPAITLTHFDLYVGPKADATDFTAAGVPTDADLTNVFTLASPLALTDFSTGSGKDD